MPRASPSRKTLDRLLARAGLCSRTQARAAIAAGRVAVDGQVVRDPDAWVDLLRQRVLVDGESLRPRSKAVWMLHKPVGYVSTRSDERGRATVYSLLPERLDWLGAVGRLDLDTSGLLLFTNDSRLANAITAPASKLPKVYLVRCDGQLGEQHLRRLRHGVELDDGPTRPATAQLVARDAVATTVRLTITEGRNRQVRRMIAALGSQVLELHRQAVGPLQLGELAAGRARALTATETAALRAAAGRPARE